MWRRRGEATSAGLSAALYSVYHGLYSEAVVSSVASAVALAEVGQFREAVQYVQKAAKALYEGAKGIFEHVKITVQRLVELFVEAVARVLAWIDEHKAYLFLMAAAAAGAVALSVALNLWGLVELEKLAHAAPAAFVAAGVKEYSREEVFNILKNDPDPYEKFKKIAKETNAGRVKLAEPWESLRVLIMPKRSEERRLMVGGGAELYSKYREDENYRRALFYAVLALEEAFSVYRKDVEEREKVTQRVEVGEEPFKKVVYVADLKQIKQLAEEEEAAFENALKVLRTRLIEYAVKYGLRNLLGVKEDVARRLAEAEAPELSEFGGVNFGVKTLAALIAYREYVLGRRGVFGAAAWYWLEVGGSAQLLYYTPRTAYDSAKRTKVERPAAVEELMAEILRRLFLEPGADHYRGFVEELTKGGKLGLMFEKEDESSYMFRLYRFEEDGGLKELGIRLRIDKVGESIIYALMFDDVERWQKFFRPGLEAAVKAAEEVGGRLPVEGRFPYMVGWVNSDVAISGGLLQMTTSHLWQLAETHALFDWSDIVVFRVNLTLEGPKPQFRASTSLDMLDDAIRKSAEGGWLKILGIKAESWEGLKQRVAENWGVVVDAAVRRLGEGVRSELEALRDRLNDDKTARETIALALLLMQAERLGVNETTLGYFAAVVSGAIGGDGYVSPAEGKVVLTCGKHAVALLWGATLAACSIEAEVRGAGSAIRVITSGGDAARLTRLYFLYGPPLLEGDDRLKNHKLAGAMELRTEGLDVSWEGLRKTKGGRVAADLTISEAGIAVKYNVYLRNKVELEFHSSDRGRVELAARLLRIAGVSAEVKKEGGRDKWYVVATTDRLAAGHERLRKALAEIVRKAVEKGWVDAGKAEGWLKKLESGLTLKEGWPKYKVGLSSSGTLEVKFNSTNPDSIAREAQWLENIGLVKGNHFTVKMPEGGKAGYVYIRREGLAYAAWLSVHGSERQREPAAEFVERILQRAEKEGEEVYGKAKEIVEEGMSRGSLRLKGFEKRVEVGGKEYVVKVIDGGAELETSESGKLLLRIKITAEVDGVRREYEITYGRYGKNEARGRAYASAEAPGGREDDAERFSALIKALTGKEPKVYRMKNGKIIIECYEGHLEGFMRYAELAEAIKKWLEETGR
ncbi:MAG: hypothetical protein LM559_01865 [Pyrobaculum sp.]|nr:hypothetical protein [Pyrobaculum sp.]